ncbi:MAG: hypothetical protein OSA07_01590 [Pseudomonadales bacterium]|nr:hypothetical protein [Pseudomonadales bacterium]|tara:strand:- start:1758 stop:2069 length:312 start_codon:yes stop_codon:yes gene_type:complete
MDNNKEYLFDKPKNVKRVMYFLYASCVFLFALDFVIHRHVYHSWENLWGFHAIYGFAGCVVLVIVATWMRKFLMRPEDYYDDEWKTIIDEKKTDKAGVLNVDD